MENTARVERTEPYLRPQQVRDLVEETEGIEAMLSAPPHIANQIQDRGAMMRHLRHVRHDLETNSPTPYRDAERDPAAKREAELLKKITAAMPTQAEMRRNPHGAVDKHRDWERRCKQDLLEWKNLRLRMHVSGMLDELPDARDVANIERYRPAQASHELGMHDVQIEAKQFFMPTGPIKAQNVMHPEEVIELRTKMAAMQALMNDHPNATIAEFRQIAAKAGLVDELAESDSESTEKSGKSGSRRSN